MFLQKKVYNNPVCESLEGAVLGKCWSTVGHTEHPEYHRQSEVWTGLLILAACSTGRVRMSQLHSDEPVKRPLLDKLEASLQSKPRWSPAAGGVGTESIILCLSEDSSGEQMRQKFELDSGCPSAVGGLFFIIHDSVYQHLLAVGNTS